MSKNKKFFNNSYALNKPYRGPLFQKRINHTHLIRKKQRTFFPKKNKPYVWLIRHRRVCNFFHPLGMSIAYYILGEKDLKAT